MEKVKNTCSECSSLYFKETSKMADLCPECSHYLYNYPNCNHKIEKGHCLLCFWDGSQSEYIKGLKK